MAKAISWIGQGLLYALFALIIGSFSNSPPYRVFIGMARSRRESLALNRCRKTLLYRTGWPRIGGDPVPRHVGARVALCSGNGLRATAKLAEQSNGSRDLRGGVR